jgi:hypothetical protein
MKKIQEVSIEDIRKILKKYLKPLFEPTKSNTAIACNLGKLEDTINSFNSLGRKLTSVNIDTFFD